MSREILFKAKGTETGKWRYGYLLTLPNMNPKHRELHIFDDATQDWYEIDPSTVCQYTGLIDKNGVKIFENDIVTFTGYSKDNRGWVRFGSYSDARGTADTNYGWFIDFIENNGYYRRDFGYWVNKIIVIGNYFDNPELLEGAGRYADQDSLAPAT